MLQKEEYSHLLKVFTSSNLSYSHCSIIQGAGTGLPECLPGLSKDLHFPLLADELSEQINSAGQRLSSQNSVSRKLLSPRAVS